MKLTKVLCIITCFTLFSIGAFALEKELTGTVTPILTTTLNVGGNGPYRGVIDEVAKQGSIILEDKRRLSSPHMGGCGSPPI